MVTQKAVGSRRKLLGRKERMSTLQSQLDKSFSMSGPWAPDQSVVVIKNVYRDKAGSTRRQFLVESDNASVKCALCETRFSGLDFETLGKVLRSHSGASARTQGNAETHLELLADSHEGVLRMVPEKRARQEETLSLRKKMRTTTQCCGSEKLIHFNALKQIHPDLVRAGSLSSRKFPYNRGIMPSFELINVDGAVVRSESHEAFEQFVVAWIFNEIVPPLKKKLSVLELGGGIGAVSSMIQQFIEVIDPRAPHVVFEPNQALANGPLSANRDRYASTFKIFNGVLSKQSKVKMNSGDIKSDHPRAWMWRTVNESPHSRHIGTVKGFPLQDVLDAAGGYFPSVIVADCEGGLIPVLDDYPELLDHVAVLYYERDPPGDYTKMEAAIVDKGLTRVLTSNKHRVWIREASFEEDELSRSRARNEEDEDDDIFSAASSEEEEEEEERRLNLLLLAEIDKVVKLAESIGECGVARAARDGPRLECLKRLESRAAPRRLASHARIECKRVAHHEGWSDETWSAGLVGNSPPVGSHDGYSVMFDDESERWDVPRRDVRAVYTKGALDWVSPWRSDHDELIDGLPPESHLRYRDER